jgi:hypothetical protein
LLNTTRKLQRVIAIDSASPAMQQQDLMRAVLLERTFDVLHQSGFQAEANETEAPIDDAMLYPLDACHSTCGLPSRSAFLLVTFDCRSGTPVSCQLPLNSFQI